MCVVKVVVLGWHLCVSVSVSITTQHQPNLVFQIRISGNSKVYYSRLFYLLQRDG